MSDCAATGDRTALGGSGDGSDFDAVLFHLREMKEGDLPDPDGRRRRAGEQRYVMFMLESADYMMGIERYRGERGMGKGQKRHPFILHSTVYIYGFFFFKKKL